MIQWDPEHGYYDDGSDALTGAPESAGAPATPFSQPSLDPTQDSYHGFDYWQNNGVDPGSMFDANGQILPGWERTANGYERAAAPSTGGGLRAPSNGSGWMPGFSGPSFKAPDPFSYQAYELPSLEDAAKEPGYDFAAKEGVKRLEGTKAAQGVYRTGGTLKDIYAWGNKFAEQNYGNVENRARGQYVTNRENAADAYRTNYGVSRDVFDREYTRAKDEYAPKRDEAVINQARSWDEFLAQLETTNNLARYGLS